jgi:anthranilate synthase component 1
MFKKVDDNEFKSSSKKNQRIAVYKEIPLASISPVSVYQKLTIPKDDSVLLESLHNDNDQDNYSFIGIDPELKFESKNNDLTIIKKNSEEKHFKGNPLKILRNLKEEYQCDNLSLPFSFFGGIIGFCSYDSIRLFEDIPQRHENEDSFPDLLFGFYNTLIIFDHKKNTILIAHIINDSSDISYNIAEQKVDEIIEKIGSIADLKIEPKAFSCFKNDDFRVDISDEKFKGMVDKAKQYIVQGDIFQVVLSRKFQKEFKKEPIDIYRVLRVLNPSPYMFYLDYKDYTIIGASPEEIISVKKNMIQSTPIAGTRKRGCSEGEDTKLEKELLSDEKELAEHMMLVDLARNDVGSVSIPGSVKVKELKSIQKFSHVMHIVSKVIGEKHPEYDSLEVLLKNFPAGTLTGAPKIRAMEIIDELETSRRGLYGGAIVTMDFEGNLNSCIAIRMICVKDNIATIRAGAGIVHDSDPKKEADETKSKAMALLDAIKIAGEEI